ncbi:MAG: PHP-associated domain-containing protein, partial [Terracoccus sp.]
AFAALETDSAVEINEKWRCPSPRSLSHLAARGVRLTAGSDAHRAGEVGRWSYLVEVARDL